MAPTTRLTTSQGARETRKFLTVTSISAPSLAWRGAVSASPPQPPVSAAERPASVLQRFPKWTDPEYRHAYVEAAIEQGLAWQIRTNRKSRGLSQEQLAQQIGTHQSAISRLEDPSYGSHSIETLLTLASAFDCALSVRFVPFSTLAFESLDLTPSALAAESFDVEWRESEEGNEEADDESE